jgi:hypothetical protein
MEKFTLGSNEFIELNSLLKVIVLCDSGGMAKLRLRNVVSRLMVMWNCVNVVKFVKGKLLNLKVTKLFSNNEWLRIAGFPHRNEWFGITPH